MPATSLPSQGAPAETNEYPTDERLADERLTNDRRELERRADEHRANEHPASDLHALAARSPQATIEALNDSLIHKVTNRPGKTALLAVLAGALIGCGYIFYVTSQMGAHDADWYGLTKLIGGLAFSAGLIMVVLTGADLFTSTTMTLIPLSRREIGVGQWARHWIIVYFGNFVGAVLLALIVFGSGTGDQGSGAWGEYVVELASAKVSHTWGQAFLLGILANLLVCLAIVLANAGRTVTDKILGIAGPVAIFVAAGFEHSIANMFLIPLGIMLGRTGDYGDASGLTVPSFLLDNLIPVTLGNIVGGGIFVGLFLAAIYLRKPEPHATEQR